MKSMCYVIICRDTTADSRPIEGLKPKWVFLKRVSDGKDVAAPPISEIRGGQYRVGPVDMEAIGDDVSGQIDMGPNVKSPSDRLVDVQFYVSDQRLMNNLDAPVSGVSSGRVVTVGAIQMGAINATAFAKGTIPTLLGSANLKIVTQ
jgi:hypothetical protein